MKTLLAGASWPFVALKMVLETVWDIICEPKNYANYASLAFAGILVFFGGGVGIKVMKFAEKCANTEVAGLLGLAIVVIPIALIFGWTHTTLSAKGKQKTDQQDDPSRRVTEFIFISYVLVEFGLGAIAAPVVSIVRSVL